jgi:Ca-activated chloride channel homolog
MSLPNNYRFNWVSFLITATIVELLFWLSAYMSYDYLSKYSQNFRFEHEWLLVYLIPVIIVFIIGYSYLIFWKFKTLSKISSPKLLGNIFEGFSTLKINSKYVLWRLSLSFLVIAAANPQFGEQDIEVESYGLEIMLAIDVSNSMLAEDLAENYSRLKVAKFAVEKLVNSLSNEPVGIVVFAGSAYKQLPITTDYSAAKMFLQNIQVGMLTDQGTDIGNAINTCLTSFNFENGVAKTIILITDGEDHEQKAIIAANEAKEKGVVIHTIGMGDEKGAPIPVFINGIKKGTKKDTDGNTVLTKINENMLIEVATAGNGSYTRANGLSIGLDGLISQLNNITKGTIQTKQYKAYNDQFQVFLLLGLLLLFVDIFVLEKKKQLFKLLKKQRL